MEKKLQRAEREKLNFVKKVRSLRSLCHCHGPRHVIRGCGRNSYYSVSHARILRLRNGQHRSIMSLRATVTKKIRCSESSFTHTRRVESHFPRHSNTQRLITTEPRLTRSVTARTHSRYKKHFYIAVTIRVKSHGRTYVVL